RLGVGAWGNLGRASPRGPEEGFEPVAVSPDALVGGAPGGRGALALSYGLCETPPPSMTYEITRIAGNLELLRLMRSARRGWGARGPRRCPSPRIRTWTDSRR